MSFGRPGNARGDRLAAVAFLASERSAYTLGLHPHDRRRGRRPRLGGLIRADSRSAGSAPPPCPRAGRCGGRRSRSAAAGQQLALHRVERVVHRHHGHGLAPSAMPSVSTASGLAIGSGFERSARSRSASRCADLGRLCHGRSRPCARRRRRSSGKARASRASSASLPHRPEHVVERKVRDARLGAEEIGACAAAPRSSRSRPRRLALHSASGRGAPCRPGASPRDPCRSWRGTRASASGRNSLIMPPPGWKPIGTVMLNSTLSAKCAAACTAKLSPYGIERGRRRDALQHARDQRRVAPDVGADLQHRRAPVAAGERDQVRLGHDHRDLHRLPRELLVGEHGADLLRERRDGVVMQDRVGHGNILLEGMVTR